MFLEWLVLYITEYEDIQEKVHESIVEAFGLNGNISLQDEHRLPLVLALMEEVARHSPVTAVSLPQCTEQDIKIRGYNIPKGTAVYNFSPGVHYDEKHFKNPSE